MKTQSIKRILFILPSLRRGGAERVVSYIAQEIDKSRFNPEVLILYDKKETDFKIKRAPFKYLNKKRTLNAIPDIVKHIYRTKPDIVFTSIIQLNILGGMLSIIFPNINFIGRESSILSLRIKPTRFNTYFKRFFYNRLNTLICQSSDMKEDLMETYSICKPIMPIIGNPITISPKMKNSKIKNKVPVFITVGRLEAVKGIERLIDILEKLTFDFKFILVGDGSLKNNILSRLEKSNLKEKLNYVPFTNDVAHYLLQADLFLQGSYVEGFPNALLESCSLGTPVIAFNAPGGTKDIVVNGVNGFIVNNEMEFYEKLKLAIFNHKWSRESIINSVTTRYSSVQIIKKYEEIFS